MELSFKTAPQAIIFDLDDTLLVDEAVSHESLQFVAEHAAREYGSDPKIFESDVLSLASLLWKEGECYAFCHSIGISAFECLWGKFEGSSPEMKALRAWSQRYQREVFQQALEKQNKGTLPLSAANLASEFMVIRRCQQRLFPRVRNLLEALSKKFKIGLLTNGASDLQREKIAATGCEDLFSAIVISGEQGIGKPNPALFDVILKELGVTSSESIMVGNSLERDIEGANAAGIYSVWIQLPNEKTSEKIQPDKTITHLEDLFSLLC